MGKVADIFTLVSIGHRSDRMPPRESPRGAHGTLQPPDESIIVGYYTLKKCRSLRFPNLTAVYQQKGALWQETTGLTAALQEM